MTTHIVNVNVTDNNSTKKVITSVAELGKELDKATTAAMKTSKAVLSATAPAKGALAPTSSKGAIPPIDNSRDSGTSRSLGPGTGAEARDFAKQAQGLGGLVHVYATFAANIFAISAAFSALSKAADTTNLIKGLDQLGSASGRNLGSLAKQLVAVTDGAVSLKEAMTATAQATAGGMASDAVLRMGNVARQASQALGIGMPDALSRLSRGIVKLEPELLDELGIMVRVDRASQDYARALGKPVSALSDFEKRQGFANAVLEQAEKKFGAIKIDANPYAKILSSMADLSQKGLELVNTVLGPLLTLLSTSPIALSTTMAGIATILLKQAIPAIGMFRQNAKMMEEEAHNRVRKLVADQTSAASDLDAHAAALAEESYRRQESTVKKLNALNKTRFNQDIIGKDTRSLLKNKSAFDYTPQELNEMRSKADMLIASEDEKFKKQGNKLAANLQAIADLRAESDKRAEEAVAARVAKDASFLSHQEQLARQKERLDRAAAKRTVISNAADYGATLGPVIAFQKLREETSKLDMGRVSKAMTLVQGSFSIATAAVSTFMAAFGPWIALFGILVAVGTAVYSMFTKTAKEAAATEEALNSLASANLNVSRTLETIDLKPVFNKLSIESIQARANAFNELVSAAELTVRRSNQELNKIGDSNLDSFTNFVSKMWGGDVQSKLNKSLTETVSTAFKTLEKGDAENAARNAISNLLGFTFTDSNDLEKKLKGLSSAGKSSLQALIPELQKLSREAGNTASKGTELKASFAESGKSFVVFMNSLKSQDPLSVLGQGMLDSATKLDIALKSPTQALLAMQETVKDSNNLSLFPAEEGKKLAGLAENIGRLANESSLASQGISSIDKELIPLLAKKDELTKLMSLYRNSDSVGDTKGSYAEQLKQINSLVDELNAKKQPKLEVLAKVGIETQDIKGIFQESVLAQFVNGAKIITTKLDESWTKAGATITGAIGSILGDTKSGIELRSRSENALLAVQAEAIKTQLRMIKVQEETNILLELNRLAAEKINAGGKELSVINKRETELKYRQTKLDTAGQKGSTNKVIDDISKGVDGAKAVLNYTLLAETAMSQLANVSAQMTANRLKKEVETLALKQKNAQQEKDIEETSLKNSLEILNLVGQSNSSAGTGLLIAKQTATARIAEMDAAKSISSITNDIAKLELIRKDSATSTEQKQKIKLDIQEKNTLVEKLKAQTASEVSLQKIKNVQEQIYTLLMEETNENNKDYAKLQSKVELESHLLALKGDQLEYMKSVGIISDTAYVKSKKELDSQLAISDTQAKIDAVRKDTNDKIAASTAEIERLEQQKLNSANLSAEVQAYLASAIAAQQTAQADLNTTTDLTVTGLLKQLEIRAGLITKTAEHNGMLAQQAELMQQMTSITESLASAFGSVGESVGKVGESFVALIAIQEANAKKQIEIEEKTAEARNNAKLDPDSYKKALEEESKLRNKSKQEELGAIANVAGATKKMFGEKTALGKAAAAIEKAIHIAKLAMIVAETAANIASVGPSTAASMTKASASGTEAIAKALSLGFPMGLIAGAIMAAVVAALLGGSGNVPSIPSGFSAEDQQKVQGTGQSYVDGQLVDNGGGALGDSKAKSKSVIEGIDKLANIMFDNLDFNKDQTYKALIAIRDNTEGFVKALGTTTGITGGLSAFGTETENKKGALGFSSSKVEIKDTGTIISGLLKDLVAGGGLKQQYENVHKESSSWWGLSSSSSNTVNTKKLADNVDKYIQGIFKGFNDTLLSAAETLGTTKEKVDETLSTLEISTGNISGMGLTGAEYADAVMSAIGIQLDIAANKAFPDLKGLSEQFQHLGETSTDFIIRLIDTVKNISLGFDSIGKVVEMGSGTLKTQISMALSEAFSGVDNYVSATKQFADDFLSEAERMAPVQKAVSTEMERLGFSSVTTKDQFKNLVLGFQITDKASAETYAALLKVAPAFSEVTSAASNALKDLASAANSAASDALSALTASINAEKDKITDIYKEQSDAIKDSISSVTAGINKLKTLATSLKNTLESLRLVNSEAQYRRIAQNQIKEAVKLARSGGGLPLDGKLDKALSIISQPSEGLFSSFTDYARDFYNTANDISELNDLTTAQLTADEVTQGLLQKQLDLLAAEHTASIKKLDDIISNAKKTLDAIKGVDSSIVSVADAINRFTKAVDKLLTANSVSGGPAPLASSSSNPANVTVGGAESLSGSGSSAKYKRRYSTAAGMVTYDVTDKAEIERYDAILAGINSIGVADVAHITQLADTAKQYGVTMFDLATASGYLYQDVVKLFATAGIPKFASGGMHAGGLRIVGENAPELEATGPSRLWNAPQIASAIKGSDNTDLAAEIKLLREEVAELRRLNQDIANNSKVTAKQLTRWDTDGMPPVTT